MLKNISLVKRQKISTCIFIILVLFLCLSVFGVSFAQSPTSKEVEKMKSIQIINPHPAFSLRLWLDRPRNDNLAPGEKITIYFQSTRDAFVTLYNYDTAGRVKIIFPNKYSPHNFIKSGQKYKVEGQIAPDTQLGTEFVQGFATTRPLLVNENIRNLISKKFMPEVSNDYRAYNSRIKSIIVSSPPATWVSSNLLSFRIVPVTPPTVHYGRIVVSSNPSGAKVYLDNSYRGTTPINLDRVNTGKHSIKLVKSGYQEWNKNVYVYSLRTTQVFTDLIVLPQFGSISVYCNQDNAKIYLDGKYKGKTSANDSLELENIEIGYHELLITKNKYKDWVDNIMVPANQTYMVSAYLVPEISYYGSIAVYCNVSGAKIFINGTYKARTLSSHPKVLEELKEGIYEITIIKDGHRTWLEDTWVYTGETASLYVEMEEIE